MNIDIFYRIIHIGISTNKKILDGPNWDFEIERAIKNQLEMLQLPHELSSDISPLELANYELKMKCQLSPHLKMKMGRKRLEIKHFILLHVYLH